MWGRIWHIVKKEFIHVLRNPRMRTTLIVPPLMQLVVLGYAIELDVRHADMAVVDSDNTRQSRELADSFTAPGRIRLAARPDRPDQATRLLDAGRVDLVLTIPQGFARDLARGGPAEVAATVDGTDATFAGLLLGQVEGSVASFNRALAAGRGPAPPPPIEVRERGWFNPNLSSRTFFVPGIIAMILMIVTLSLTSMAIVREKELGTLEQLMVSPLTPAELLLGKTIPFAVIAMGEVGLIATLARLLFGLAIKGSVALLFFSSALYLLSCLGAGLLISTISRTQQQAMLTTFLFLMPANLLSGFAFPIANMPSWIQLITWLDPLRFFLVVIRGIMLKGVGVAVLWPEMLALLALGALFFGMGVLRFHRTLD